MANAIPLLTAILLGSLAGACQQSNPDFDEPTGSGSSSSSGGATTVAATTSPVASTGTTGIGSTSTGPTSTGSQATSSTTAGSETTNPSASDTSSSSSSSTGDTDACVEPSQVCEGICVDVTSDAMHCGKCGNSCPGNQVCTKSDCGPG